MTTSLSKTIGKSYNYSSDTGSTFIRPNDNNWGIDTVAFYFPVDIADCDHTSDIWQYEGARNRQKAETEGGSVVANLICGHANVHINLYMSSSLCRVEVNAARVLYPKSEKLLHPGALSHVIEVIIDQLTGVVSPIFDTATEAGEIIRDPKWQVQITFTRLDVTRDFFISDPAIVRLGLAHIKSKNQKSHKVTTSPNDGWSIESGTKYEGKDIFYDKKAELRQLRVDSSSGNPGVIYRFESVLKKTRLSKSGMKNLSEVNDERVWAAIQSRWEKTGWHAPLPSSSGFLEAVSHLSQTRMDGLIGYLHRRAAGQEDSIPPHYRREKDKLALSCGLTPGLPVELLGKATKFLDLESGRIKKIPLIPPI